MVHNGIEYGLMQAYAEGYELMAATKLITNVTGVMEAWSRGTVVRSWLLDLLVLALKDDPGLIKLSDYVDDSGEGRWTIEEAIRHAVPLPVISAALFARFTSRQESSPAMRAVAALRHQFGGHAVHQVGPSGTPGQLAGPSSGTGSTPAQTATAESQAGPTSGTGSASDASD
jgi:6-phosphogluconate dehydrogenase